MNAKKGDKVRFLNEEGGGKVSRIEGRTIYVMDEDGFEIPVTEHDIVVVSEEDAQKQGSPTPPVTASKPKREKKTSETRDNEAEEDETRYDEDYLMPTAKKGEETTRYSYDAEATDDNDPHFALALTRTDGGKTGTLDLHVVNDSNYFASYVVMRIDSKGEATTIDARTIEPNTKEKIDTMNPQQVDGQTWRVSLLLYKKYRSYRPIGAMDVELKPKSTKLFRDSSFVENDYFDEKAMVMHVIRDEMAEKVEQLRESDLRKGAGEGRHPEPAKKSVTSKPGALIEVDLHIEELLPDTRGLDNKDMLKVQTDHFKTVMEQNRQRKGQKIVFIHGVGQGVLKAEILRLLRTSYPTAQVQDASFSEYGFGATMVTI